MKKFLLGAAFLAMSFSNGLGDNAQPKITNPHPVLITTGLTFQQLYAKNTVGLSLTIQNNNATDACNLLIGGPWLVGDTTSTTRTVNGVSLTAAQASISLAAITGVYTRYYPYVPSDQILVTCATTGDSLYADTQ